VSFGFAERHYGGAEAAVGQLIRLGDQSRTIVGVMPREFAFPDLETQVWVRQAVPPVTTNGGQTASVAIFSVLARIRLGVTPEQAAAEATARARAAESLGAAALGLFGSDGEVTVDARPALDVLVGEVRPAIVVLFAAVILLFGTAVASVAGVQIARAARRRREMIVRAALGASTARLTRQWLVESALVAAGGAVAGLLIVAVLHANVMLIVRTADEPLGLVPIVRSLVREQAPGFVMDSIMTMEDRVMNSLAKPRTYALLLIGFAACALTIASTGLFGVLSLAVAQRTREIGVRTALGATARDVVHLVLRQAATVVAFGLSLGLMTAFATVEWLSKLLYGVSPYDTPTFIAAPAIVAAIAALACLVPARRAARIDPLRALRS
jgi:ABC-type antimicrobial peptide transport system permease subunit